MLLPLRLLRVRHLLPARLRASLWVSANEPSCDHRALADPTDSYKLTSCMPDPMCVSHTTDFTNLSQVKVQNNGTKYNGNATANDWVVNSGQLVQGTAGTRLILNQTNGTFVVDQEVG